MSLSSSAVVIGGANVPYTATIQNVGATTAAGMGIQNWMNQGTTRPAANWTLLRCGSNDGVVPTGTCEISFSYGASNTASGTGTLIAGPATLELDLLDGNNVVRHKRFVSVMLTNQ